MSWPAMSPEAGKTIPTSGLLRRAVPRAAALAGLWLVLTGGDTGTWYIGALAVVAGTLSSLALLPERGWRWTPGGFARFVPFFLWKSISGGMDVALRALHPRMPLDPEFLDYDIRLPQAHARIFLANTTSLLPGTLSAELEGRRLRVHTLAHGPEVLEDLRKEEVLISELFGLQLLPDETTEKADG